MEIDLATPPIWDEVVKLFHVTESDPIFYTWANTIHSPSKRIPSDDLMVHESVHSEQQGHSNEGAKEWWTRYLHDEDFRIEQEAEAYGEQFRFLKRKYHDRNQQARILYGLAGHLAGPMYGSIISQTAAMKKISAYSEGAALDGIEDHMEDESVEL